MRELERDRTYLEPFLKDPNYIKPKNRRKVVRHVRTVWEDSAALIATVESVARAAGVKVLLPEDEGYFEDEVVRGREHFHQVHQAHTAEILLDLRGERVPDFVTTDAVAGASWEYPMNITPIDPRMERLGAIVDHMEEVGAGIPRDYQRIAS